MARFRPRFNASDIAYGQRVAEHQQIERRLSAERWISIAILVWLVAEAIAAGFLCAGVDLPNDGSLLSSLSAALHFGFAATACVAFAVSAAAAIITVWNRHLLSAGWLFSGTVPWLLVVVEAAVILPYWSS